MSFIKDYIERQTLNRRTMLLISAYGLCGAAATAGLRPARARAAGASPRIAWSYRDRTNPCLLYTSPSPRD